MTNQEFLDKVVAHLRRQGKPARLKNPDPITYPEGGPCAYRTPEGLMCAVGGTMTPELLDLLKRERMNTAPFRTVRQILPQVREFFDGVDKELISEAQRIHDMHHPSQWEYELSCLAKLYGLVYTPPAKPEGEGT